MYDYYGEFNHLAEEFRQIFSITFDMKQMQNQWNQLMVLTYLGTLDPVYSSARSQIMGSSVMSFLPKTSFLKTVVPEGTFDTTTTTLDRSALAAQG